MGQTEGSGRQEVEKNSRLNKIAKFFTHCLRGLILATIDYLLVIATAILMISGVVGVYDVFRCTTVPEVYRISLSGDLGKRAYGYDNIGSITFNEEIGWQSIQTALKILDEICPEVAHWVRKKHADKDIVWENENTGCYARFNFVSRKLILNRVILHENNGFRASVLAHEYRHSLQDFVVMFHDALALLIFGEEKYEIAENDAHLFEYEVYIAIFVPERFGIYNIH